MGYKTEKLKSGALLVKDVPLMATQKLTAKHFKIKNINREWMDASLETFSANKAKGKLPYLWDRHNEPEQAATVIGRLDNLRVERIDDLDWMFADVIITDAAHQEKFLQGKYPSKSVEFQPDNHYLRGLALLDGQEGHFDFEVPDFVPEGLYDELVALGLDPEAHTVLYASKAPSATGEDIAMTKEELQAMLEANNSKLLGEVDKKLSANRPNATGDVDDALQTVREQERATAAVKIAKAERDSKIKAYTAQLHSKTGTPEALITKKLSTFKTDEGMDTYFGNEMKRADEDVKLEMEREATGEADLAESYEEYKRNYPNTTVGMAEYIALQKRAEVPHNVRFAGRKVHNVAFA